MPDDGRGGGEERSRGKHRHRRSRSRSPARRHKHRHRDRDRDRDRDRGGADEGGHRSGGGSRRHKHRSKGGGGGGERSERDLVKEAKKFLKAKLQEGGAGGGGGGAVEPAVPADFPVTEISEDEYFLKNPEFCHWLVEYNGLYFTELGPAARGKFAAFVDQWNGKLLSKKYYDGLPGGASVPRTRPTANLAGLPRKSKDTLVREMEERRESDRRERGASKQDRRKWKQEQKLLLDEMAPKATGREAKFEKAALRREERRAREDSPEMNTMIGGGSVMGGDDSFAAHKARQARRQEQRDQRLNLRRAEAQEKLAAHQAREDAKMAQFKALLGKGNLQIAKR